MDLKDLALNQNMYRVLLTMVVGYAFWREHCKNLQALGICTKRVP